MITRYVLINTKPKQEHKIYNNLSTDSRIVELKPLFKEYDMIAKVKTQNNKKFKKFISHSLRSLEGVVDTKIIQ